MITAIAIDDEPPALKVIEQFCNKVEFIKLVKTFTKPHDALKYLKKFPADLIFLDVKMPSLSGIQLHKELRQDTMVIFTTAYAEYALEGFNLSAVDFLLKPFTFERFNQAAAKANDYYKILHRMDNTSMQYLFIRADYSLIKIDIADILYIEGLDDYLKIHLTNRNPVVARMTMKGIIEKLPAKEFIRVHRSFIVALKKIDSIRNKTILLAGIEIPVGISYEENFSNLFKNKS